MNIDFTYAERALIASVIGSDLSARRAQLGALMDAQRRGEDVDPMEVEVIAERVEILAGVNTKVAETFR